MILVIICQSVKFRSEAGISVTASSSLLINVSLPFFFFFYYLFGLLLTEFYSALFCALFFFSILARGMGSVEISHNKLNSTVCMRLPKSGASCLCKYCLISNFSSFICFDPFSLN